MIHYKLFLISAALFTLGFVAEAAALFPKYRRVRTLALTAVLSGFFLETMALVERGLVSGHAPWANLYEAVQACTWLMMTGSLMGCLMFRTTKVFLGTLPLAAASIIFASSLPEMYISTAPLSAPLRSFWLWVHVPVILGGYAAYAIATGAAALYFVRETSSRAGRLLPSLDVLDEIIFRSIAIGTTMLGAGIVLGSLWAYEAWGSYWSWDPKETAALVMFIVYAVILYLRIFQNLRRRALALSAIMAFLMIVLTFLGANFWFAGLHSYAK